MATGPIVDSITRNGRHEPFELQVSRGLVSNHFAVTIFGYSAALTAAAAPTTAPICVWEYNSAYIFPPPGGIIMLLSSTNASDAGLTITIEGLDSNYNRITENILFTASNISGVATVNSFLRINSMYVSYDSTSPGTINVGTIKLQNNVATTTYAQISPGIGRSQMTVYTVPNNFNFCLVRSSVFTSQAYTVAGNSLIRELSTNNVTGAAFATLQSPFVGNLVINHGYPFTYAPKTDIQWQVGTNVTSISVGVNVEGVLVAIDSNVV